MVCEVKVQVLEDLKKKNILGEFNDILDPIEFEKFNIEFSRYIQLTHPNVNTKGELLFSTYETQTRYPYSSRYYRDDIQTNLYAQPNDELFEAIQDDRERASIKEEMGDLDIMKEADAIYNEDDSINPMFMRRTASKLQDEYDKRFRIAMLDFMKGLNIQVQENADEIIPLSWRTYTDRQGVTRVKTDPMSGFDLLQKFLRLKKDITNKDIAKQNANVILSFLGKKSKLGIELWKGINSWSKYQEVYDRYNKPRDLVSEEDDVFEMPTMYGEQDVAEEIVRETYEYDPNTFNPWAHKQVIIEFMAEMLQMGITQNYKGEKRANPDISKEYFEKLGYRDKYAKNWLARVWNMFWNWIQEHILNNSAISIYSENQLIDTVMDIVDDVYKKDYTKFIRNYYLDPNTNTFVSNKGEQFEQKFYEQSLERDAFAKEVVTKLFNGPFDYYLSGSLVLRNYGRVLRAVSEDLHDIDGVITLEQFRKEKNSEAFLNWVRTRGLELMKSPPRTTNLAKSIINQETGRKNAERFKKEILPYLEDQSWYQNLKEMFPSWTFENAFIGRDHKKGESITITGYIEHPTETEIVEDGTASWGGRVAPNMITRPKRYVLDFFLRTDEGSYPEKFDHYFKDWKQIFEAKVMMGRGKDLTDLIYFIPTTEDRNKFTNRGFRYFTFADDVYAEAPDAGEIKIDEKAIKDQRAKEAATALAEKLSLSLGVQFQNISEEQAKQLLESRKKPYNGEPAFYFGGTVYVVGDNINFETVLHEFSHPFLRAIYRENPELFENLYTKLLSTTEGEVLKKHVLASYPELNEIDPETGELNPLFMEEVLVWALQLKAVSNVTERVNTSGFDEFIKSLMGAIRKLLKAIFGQRARVGDIDVDTNLTDLAKMMLEKDFDLSTPDVTEEDVVSYIRDVKAMSEELMKNTTADRIQMAINETYATANLVIDRAENYKSRSPVYQKMLRETLLERGSEQLLRKMTSSLASYQTLRGKKGYSVDEAIKDTLQAERLRQEDLARASRAFVNTVTVANNIAKNIFQDLDLMQKRKDYDKRDAVTLLFTYRSAVRTWSDMFESFDDLLFLERENFDISEENDLVDLINELKNNLLRADNKIKEIYKENNINFYVEVTGYMNDFLKEELGKNLKNALTGKLSDAQIEDFYKKIITDELDPDNEAEFYKLLADKDIPEKYIKKFVDDYKRFSVNIDKITDGLSGKLKDVSWFNRFFESYTSSNDPIVGGLAIFINNEKTEASQTALNKSYKFRQKLEKILPRINFNKLNTRQILDLVTFEDKVLFIDPKTGEPTVREVYTFLNEYKDYRYDLGLLEFNNEKAFASDDTDKQKEAAKALAQFNKDYMWDDYVPEVYARDEIFDKYGEVGKMAWLARKMALDAYNNENNEISNELERFQKYSTLQALWSNYQQLFSLKYLDNTDKVDDPENGIYDLSIAKILLEYREATKEYWEFTPREGSLQTAFNQFLSALDMDENLSQEEKDQRKKEWIKQNTRVAYDQKYFDSRKELITKIKEIQEKVNKVIGEEFDMAGAFDEIYTLMFAFKDEQGQPIPHQLGVDKMRRIKELHQKIINFKASFDASTGLSVQETEELDLFIAIAKKDPSRLTPEQKGRLRYLLDKQAESGMSLEEIASLQSLYSDLAALTQKIPTEYYLDALNSHLQRLQVEPINMDQADDFINSDEFKALVREDGKLATWFAINHVTKKIKKKRKTEIRYERSMANSISIPKNPEYIIQTTLLNEITGKEEIINGVPNARHSTYRVKKKYRTGYNPETDEIELKVGYHVDNKGQYLPRPYIPGDKNSAKDSKYINEKYQAVKAAGGVRLEFLELLKDNHLAFQDGKANNSKLYMDIPRYVNRDTLSRLQGGEAGRKFEQIKEGVSQYITDRFGKAVDEINLEHNYDRDNNMQEYRMVNTDLNAQEVYYIPVSGLYNIEKDNVDPDVLQGMFKYLLSLETQSKLLQSLPLVNSIVDTLEDPDNAIKTPNTISRNIKRLKGKDVLTTKPGATNNRAGQVRSLMEREYYGVQFSGEGSSVYLDKLLSQIQKASARASLAINIPSDLKNRYGQIVQNIIEASGKEFVTVKDLAQARLWAASTMLEWSTKAIYSKGVPPLSSQFIEMFDSAFRFEDNFGRSVTRNMAKDMLNGTWMYDIRKNLEMEAALQLFGAFMVAEKVEQKLSNGKTITINYKDAWQVNKETGIAELKPGIDPAWYNLTVTHDYVKGETLEQLADRYNVTVEELRERNKVQTALEFTEGQEVIIAKSEKFKNFRNKFHGVSHRLYGAYDAFAQAEGNKFVPYRAFMFMRKWFTPMFTNRFGASVNIENGLFKPKFEKRYDWMTGKPTIGFYINAFQGLSEVIKSRFKAWPYLPLDQKRDLMRVMAEGLKIIGFALLAAMMFGYDPDDKERFQKMKARSGTFGTDQFNTWGFMQNQMLILLLGVQAETSAFIPLPTIAGVNLGADDYLKMVTTTTSSFGNTIGLYAKIIEDIFKMLVGSEKAYYSRKEGDYSWQQEGSPKIIGHLLRTVGVTGSTGDTAQALENLELSSKIR